ncbi:HEPN domain-containing protein [Promicromonospora sp. NPDC060204]|uniref:HEPN domain-containing protein n=1 Tax=Promicromonospora sp. NPDC060204 TaxID=3347071 RepID=UPI00366242CA
MAPIIASVIAPRDGLAYVTTRLTDVCNGVEALAAQRWGSNKSELPQADVAILNALKVADGIPAKSRRRVENLLRRDWTLQSKLELLAQDLGEESSRWLLGPSVSDWALLVVRLRNSVAHGSVLPGGLSSDAHFLTFAYETLAAVLQLALFRVCGYENPQAEAGGELLRAPGRFVASHPYSTFYRRLEQLAQQAGFWAVWRQRLDDV